MLNTSQVVIKYRVDTVCVIQEESTHINVGSYWPSVLASGAMLLATDALSIQRTVGFYMLSVCDLSTAEIADFAHFHGSSESLLTFAMTYDDKAAQLLNQHIFDTSLQRNVTELWDMMHEKDFDEMCKNLTQEERIELSMKWGDDMAWGDDMTWGDDMATYILTIDDIREDYVIDSILQVNHLLFVSSCHHESDGKLT